MDWRLAWKHYCWLTFARGKRCHNATLPANETVDPFTKRHWLEAGVTGPLVSPESFRATSRSTTKSCLTLDTVQCVCPGCTGPSLPHNSCCSTKRSQRPSHEHTDLPKSFSSTGLSPQYWIQGQLSHPNIILQSRTFDFEILNSQALILKANKAASPVPAPPISEENFEAFEERTVESITFCECLQCDCVIVYDMLVQTSCGSARFLEGVSTSVDLHPTASH